MSANSTDPAATARYAERYPQQFHHEHDTELASTFWRKHDPLLAIAAIVVSLIAALIAVYWMPLLPPA